jgi:hypothetical protein
MPRTSDLNATWTAKPLEPYEIPSEELAVWYRTVCVPLATEPTAGDGAPAHLHTLPLSTPSIELLREAYDLWTLPDIGHSDGQSTWHRMVHRLGFGHG